MVSMPLLSSNPCTISASVSSMVSNTETSISSALGPGLTSGLVAILSPFVCKCLQFKVLIWMHQSTQKCTPGRVAHEERVYYPARSVRLRRELEQERNAKLGSASNHLSHAARCVGFDRAQRVSGDKRDEFDGPEERRQTERSTGPGAAGRKPQDSPS